MCRKNLEELFSDIDYSQKLEEYEKKGSRILERTRVDIPQNTIKDDEEIRMFLAKFMYKIEDNYAFKFSDKFEKEHRIYYKLAINLLEKKYPFKYDPPPLEFYKTRRWYDPPLQKLRYKTADHVHEIIKSGSRGGAYNILKLLVTLSAESRAENRIFSYVINYLENLELKDQIRVSREYISKYGEYLPKEFREMEMKYFAYIYLKKVLNEHPIMMRRLKISLNKKRAEFEKKGY